MMSRAFCDLSAHVLPRVSPPCYPASNGEEWLHSSGWEASLHAKHAPGSHVGWHGVHTLSVAVQRVVNVVLPKNGLRGPLPEEIKWMDKLRTLSLQQNAISGPIPPAWSSLTSLTTLDLSSNMLTGPLPARFFDGVKRNRDARDKGAGLRTINLSGNQLWGEIPYTISTLVSLTTLNLTGNAMSQELPEGLFSCTSLKTLRLGQNKFTGPLPKALSKLSSLMVLEAAGNELEGEIPALPTRLVSRWPLWMRRERRRALLLAAYCISPRPSLNLD